MSDSESDSNLPVSGAKDVIAVVGQLIQMAGEDPKAKEAASNIGQAAVTVTRTLNNVLLPLAAVNFAIEKARQYFGRQFAKDLEERAAHIPEGEIIEPKASLAGPALQGLAFTIDEPDLKAMYLGLLATAMDRRAERKAHCAFVEIIKQIDPNEIGYLKLILTKPGYQAIVSLRLQKPNSEGFTPLRQHYMPLLDSTGTKEIDEPDYAAMVENWVRLGLVDVDYTQYLLTPGVYDWVQNSSYFIALKNFHEKMGDSVVHQNGIIGRTDFGAKFASAVGMYYTITVSQTSGSGASEAQ